ncbi:PREDICTED: uncharacterized protein LOC107357256 isoform X2 [Acropora digitifera]|uniref:uncharacterized protein LOC107357256 isoform X2 n=1 Tax=Acropora digitifera TaxID=70779 RepID=UPI00077A0FE8|nr:PREDICTED: uncharacterized protein LOC107357256 isoform X2 [Acropora digitifera]
MAVVLHVSLLFMFLLHPCISANCGPLNKDIKVLKEQDYWYFEHPKAIGSCKHLKPEGSSNSTCIFYFSICKPVPRYCPDNSGICLVTKVSFLKENTTLYSEFINIGSYSQEFKSEANSFTLVFLSGEVVPPATEPPITELQFQCDRSATWNSSSDGKVSFQPKVSLSQTKYTIVFDYSGACKNGGGHGGDEGPTGTLSVGSILLILFFPGMFLYCVVGALIRKGQGKTGKDVIPHAQFLSDLPGLIADGFSFTLAKITCSQMFTTQQKYDQM